MALRYRWYVTDGIRARVETLGPIWAHNAPTYFVLELMIEFPCDNRNQQVHIVLQYRYLQMYQTQIFIDLVVVQEKVECFFKTKMKKAITFATSTSGKRHKYIGILLFP